ncbi:DUF4397 domain-containing protein [Pseudoflavitalea sp. X16]|uniref:DUF4397 domain-containing protein n=1 Tax=Paraflavitalea devenefica TaxID=2716334 RepID=UPI0014225852|nr:DUF4397 domain-containing protein [Paraflavitalea devenefica]NII26255.1 DUF4397 domain-containing protein [Paraflavitalea devenefica]
MRNILFRYLPAWVLIGTVLSCSKQTATPTASLTLINAIPGSTPSLVTNFSGASPITWYKNALKLVYGTSTNTNLALAYQGEQKLAIYRFPDTTAHSTPLFNLDLHLQPGNIYSLFLTGTLTEPDTLFTTDVIPYYPSSDSSVGIRFVNLSPGSSPVSINIAGMPDGSEVGSLTYKGITGFKKYPATAASASKYPFEFRDAATGTLLGSFDVTGINGLASNTRRFRNFTLAFMGLPADATTRKIILIEAFFAN